MYGTAKPLTQQRLDVVKTSFLAQLSQEVRYKVLMELCHKSPNTTGFKKQQSHPPSQE
jgi:hypothetical protein